MKFTKQPNETFAELHKRIHEFEMKLFKERIATISKDWDLSDQHYQPHPAATDEERAAAREVIKDEAAFQSEYDDELYQSSKATHWMYKHNGKYYFNKDEKLGEYETFSEAMSALRDKYDPVGFADDYVKLCDAKGNTKVFPLSATPAQAAKAHTWHQIGDLARRAKAAQKRYKGRPDPQLERSLLMAKHGLTFDEAVRRWPLSQYGKWE